MAPLLEAFPAIAGEEDTVVIEVELDTEEVAEPGIDFGRSRQGLVPSIEEGHTTAVVVIPFEGTELASATFMAGRKVVMGRP